jgi:mRNA interferase HicA
MKASELKRWLKAQGCTFEEGTRHTKVMLKGKVSLLPRHPAVEVRTGTYRAILKDLGLRSME